MPVICFSGVFSTIRAVVKAEGAEGLFRGNSAQLIRVFPYAAIQFTSYELYKNYLKENKPRASRDRRNKHLKNLVHKKLNQPLPELKKTIATIDHSLEVRVKDKPEGYLESIKMKLDLLNNLNKV